MADPYPRPDTFRYPHVPSSPLLDDREGERREWPTWVGTGSIVFAALGLVCNGCNAVNHAVPGLMAGLMPQGSGPPPTGSMAMLALSAVAFGWSILLMIAGISTLRRSPSGRALHLVWAVGAVLLAAIGLVVGYYVGQQQMQAQLQHMQNDPKTAQQAQQIAPFMNTIFYVTMACGGLFSLAWPVFCLIWFGAVKRNAAEIAAGVEPSGV